MKTSRGGKSVYPLHPKLLLQLSLCLKLMGLAEEALTYLRKAQKVEPESQEIDDVAGLRKWRLDEGWALIEPAADQGFEPAQRVRKAGRQY